jgi:hypothetical protein
MRKCKTCGEVVVCESPYYWAHYRTKYYGEMVNCKDHMGGWMESDRKPKPDWDQFDDQCFLNGY